MINRWYADGIREYAADLIDTLERTIKVLDPDDSREPIPYYSAGGVDLYKQVIEFVKERVKSFD